MKIYYGQNKLKAKKISLKDLLISELSNGEFEPLPGSFGDKSGSWIEIKRQQGLKEVLVVFSFDYQGEIIDGISVYVAPIVTQVDEDKRVKLI